MSMYNYLKGDASTSKAPQKDQDWGIENSGPYIGIVKGNKDPLRAGRLKVLIPALTGTYDGNFDSLVDCDYLSPFYGTKGLRHNKPGQAYDDSQFSYGFWAVPPDLETRVLVIFAEGKMDQAFWIGCIQEPLTNHMTPGIASSDKVKDQDGKDGVSKYGTKNLPAGEVNRYADVDESNYQNKDRPLHPFAETLLKSGLIGDDVRGTTSSSAQREAPSSVFGMSTPGRVNEKKKATQVSTSDSNATEIVERLSGHTFVMDDGAEDGTNQLTRLRTASGHQLLMHDTEGVVYLANGTGKAFIEMDADGTVSVYSEGGINMRSGRDFNVHSDMHINFHAKGQINFTSETNIALNAEGYLFAMGEQGILNSSQKGSVRNYARDGISSFTDGTQLHGAGGRIDLAGSQVHFNSVGASSTWGPGWLNPDAIGIKVTEGLIDIDDDNPLPQGKPNKIENKTTVSDFVTHEPYDRQSSTARTKAYINEAMAEIKKSSPDLSATELKVIKAELLKQPSIKAVSEKLSKVVKLNDKIKLPVDDLKKLVVKAEEIYKLITLDPKEAVISFIQGQVAELKNQAIGAIKDFFRF
tara:strand:+ start:4509 stop:6251 length:1743 start_codon:yes stop_codon:yes gene_type:complete